jgi:hypothetical protein
MNEAEQILRRCTESAQRLAGCALAEIIREVGRSDGEVVASGIVLGSDRPPMALEKILSSHALVHAAEGEMYRDVLMRASEECGLRVTGVRERELFDVCAATIGIGSDGLQRRLAEIGRAIGPPWRQDEKYATLAAWLALVSGEGARRGKA